MWIAGTCAGLEYREGRKSEFTNQGSVGKGNSSFPCKLSQVLPGVGIQRRTAATTETRDIFPPPHSCLQKYFLVIFLNDDKIFSPFGSSGPNFCLDRCALSLYVSSAIEETHSLTEVQNGHKVCKSLSGEWRHR